MEFFIDWFIVQLLILIIAFSAIALIICFDKIKRGDFDEKEERRKK